MIRLLASTGREDIAKVYVAEGSDGKRLEFVESIQPPLSREEKWVLIISTLYGCPVGCRFCDAGGSYSGKISKEDLLGQLDHMVMSRYPNGRVPSKKFKIQFARMGEPAYNDAVLDVMEELPRRYHSDGLLLSFSTVAPRGRERFFDRLLDIKQDSYQGRFQFQFSLHTTDEEKRKWLIPSRTWGMEEMAAYGKEMRRGDARKVVLNFALGEGLPLDPDVLLKNFDPSDFIIKLTPVNPTFQAMSNSISSKLEGQSPSSSLEDVGYEVIVSVGEAEENLIGSNCGQYLKAYEQGIPLPGGYTYPLQDV